MCSYIVSNRQGVHPVFAVLYQQQSCYETFGGEDYEQPVGFLEIEADLC